ncbi:DUF5317 domain-containing protein [Paenibacillus sp. Z3-2]
MFSSLGLQILLAYYTKYTGNKIPYLLEVTFFMMLVCLWLNRAKPGIKLILSGCLLNFIVLTVNGGKMPVSLIALKAARLEHLNDYSHSSRHQGMEDSHLYWLGDWIPFITPVGTNYVLSPGDVLVGFGLILFILGISKRRIAAYENH